MYAVSSQQMVAITINIILIKMSKQLEVYI